MMTFRQFLLLEKKKPKKHKWGTFPGMKIPYGRGWTEKIIKQMSQDQLEKELWDE